MSNSVRVVFSVLFCTVTAFSFSQASKVRIQKNLPAWVEPMQFDATAAPPSGQQGGFYYLLIDEQEHTLKQERYLHIAYKILTTEGIQGMSDLTFGFDPSYQTISLHAANLYRDGKKTDQLAPPVRTIQREQSMDRYLYDGSVTAIINLTDVRVGDIIEFAFTQKGYNPVFKDHISKKIYLDYNLPYERLFQRLIVPKPRNLNLQYKHTDEKPDIVHDENHVEYTWSQSKVAGLITDNNAPDWYDPYKSVTITDFNNWHEVALWATLHFAISAPDQQAVTQRIADQFQADDDETFALNAIRFVQDEIRYLGFESGLNSHKPHSPVKVFDQRFGDCKDKSLLLCSILRSKNIEAYPVLVSTVLRDKVGSESPSFMPFNHCVVQIHVNNKIHYVDPTISNQGGTLSNIAFPQYGKGLVINEGTDKLQEILPHADIFSSFTSDISEQQTVIIPNFDGDAYLQVRTTYTGGQADYIRSQFLGSNQETMQKNYVTFYGNLYPEIEVFAPITHRDNREGNIFTVEENYKLPGFWKQNEDDDDQLYGDIYALSLEDYFNVAKSAQRTAPYSLGYPVSYHHSVDIRLPEEWTVAPTEKLIENAYYQYEHQVRYSDKEVSLQTHYQTKQDHVPLEAFSQFVADHQDMMANLSFQLSYNKKLVGNSKGISWLGLVTALTSIAIGLWLALRLYYYYDPTPPLAPDGGGQPIGGWLILIAIGLFIAPFRIIIDLFNLPEVYDSQTWSNLLALDRYDLFGFILVTHVYNLVFLAYAVLILILFIKRRSSLPRLISVYLAVNCGMTVIDTIVGAQLDIAAAGERGYYSNMISSILGAAIWIPYFNMSDRVKETFVTRINNDDDDPEYAVESTVNPYSSASDWR